MYSDDLDSSPNVLRPENTFSHNCAMRSLPFLPCWLEYFNTLEPSNFMHDLFNQYEHMILKRDSWSPYESMFATVPEWVVILISECFSNFVNFQPSYALHISIMVINPTLFFQNLFCNFETPRVSLSGELLSKLEVSESD